MTIRLGDLGFSVEGPVSFANVVALRKQGEHEIRQAKVDCIVDLSAMKDQDASSFSMLLCFMRCALKHGKKLQFVNASSSLKRMQHLFGLGKILHG